MQYYWRFCVINSGQMNDTLVGAAPEWEVGVAEFHDERPLHKGIDIRKYLRKTLVGKDFLICKARITPYILARLFLYAAGKFCKGLDLIERIAAGEGHIGKLVILDDVEKLLDGHFLSAAKVP